MFAALLGVIVNLRLPAQQLAAWGWRIPLIAGCAIIPFLLLIRRSLAETDEFLAQKERPSLREILAALGVSWKIVLAGMMLSTMTTVTFYMITAYTPTFGQTALHLASLDSFTGDDVRRDLQSVLAAGHGIGERPPGAQAPAADRHSRCSRW